MQSVLNKNRVLQGRKIRLIGTRKGLTKAQPYFIAPIMPEGGREYITGSEYSEIEKLKKDQKDRLESVLEKSRKMFIDSRDETDASYEATFSVPLDHLMSLDLSTDKDAAIYNLSGISGVVAPSKGKVNPAQHYYYVEDRDEEAQELKLTLAQKQKAYNHVAGVLQADIPAYLYYILKDDPKRMSPLEQQAALMKAADEQPATIVKAFEQDDIELCVLLSKIILKGIVKKAGNGKYMSGELVVGLSFDDTIKFMKDEKHAGLVSQWQKDLKAK